MNYILKYLLISFFILGSASLLRAQWTPTNGPEGGYILSFASTDSIILAGTDGGGVYISTNGGSSWFSANNGLNNLTVNALLVSGNNLFAGVGSSPFEDGGIFLSKNNGLSWTPVNDGLPATVVVTCLTEFNGKLFAGTLGNGIYISSNHGLNWNPDTVGLINMYVTSLTVKDTCLFAGTAGVCRSTINDTTWKWCAPADMYYISVSSIAVNDSSLFVSGSSAGVNAWGIFRSSDNGSSWLQVNSGLESNYISKLAVLNSELFAGADDGVIYRSTNNGLNWTGIDTMVASISNLTAINNNLFAGTYGGGAFLSTNKGESWTAINSGLKNSKVNSVTVKDSIIFAGTMAAGIFRSTDGGDSWSQVNKGLTSLDIGGLAVSNSNIFAGVMGGGVFKSINEGLSWSKVGSDIPGLWNTFALAAINSEIFAGTLGPGVYRSSDNGESWNLVNNGLTTTVVNALASSDSNLFAGTYYGGVFLSTNHGESWINRGLKDLIIEALAVNGRNLFAKTIETFETKLEYGIFVSTNNGESWTKVDSGAYTKNILSLAANSANLYAGSPNGVVYQPVSKITSVHFRDDLIPRVFNLYQNYPNPFNPSTKIKYVLSKGSNVNLAIYNILGEKVAELVDSFQKPGNYELEWNAKDLSSGVYIYQIKAGNFILSKKLILLK